MSKKKQRLPDAELEVMLVVWGEENNFVTSSIIMEKLKGKKEWGVTTVLNLLSRLIERGFVSCQRQGRVNIYSALVSEENYLESESKSFLEKLHGNSLKSLVSSLYSSNSISNDDLAELKTFIDEKTRRDL